MLHETVKFTNTKLLYLKLDTNYFHKCITKTNIYNI